MLLALTVDAIQTRNAGRLTRLYYLATETEALLLDCNMVVEAARVAGWREVMTTSPHSLVTGLEECHYQVMSLVERFAKSGAFSAKRTGHKAQMTLMFSERRLRDVVEQLIEWRLLLCEKVRLGEEDSYWLTPWGISTLARQHQLLAQ